VKSRTELKIEYVYLSWDFDFPPAVESALEDDYVVDHHKYDRNVLNRVAQMLLISPHVTSEQAIAAARGFC